MLARNWRCPHGEIDLVLGRPGLVVFCEVKARASGWFGGAAAAVDHRKQMRLRRLAAAWLAATRGDAGEGRRGLPPVEVRFDVAAMVGARLEVIEGAF